MTDLDNFIEIYKSLDIELKVFETNEGKAFKIGEGSYQEQDITISSKFGGYGGFYSIVRFSRSGEFLGQDFFE